MKIKNSMIVVVLLLLLFAWPVSAQSEQSSYVISELELEIDLPESYSHVLTRDISEDDPDFAELGLTKEQLFADDSVYLEAFSDQRNAEIIVTMLKNEWSELYYDFNNLSEDDLTELADICLMNEDSLLATEYETFGLFRGNEQAQFLKAVGTFSGEESSGTTVQYVTVINGEAYTITFNFVGEGLSAEQEAMTEDVISSVAFERVTPRDESESNAVFIVVILCLVVIIGILLAVIRKQKYSIKNLNDELTEDKD